MILVTGATGKLGGQVIQQLVEKVPSNRIVAAVRDPGKAADLAKLGVHVRFADYDRPDTLASALAGVSKVLLISASELGGRLARHRAVIDAAKRAGVRLLVYTSLLHAESSTLALAAGHRATEEAIRASGLPFVFLRNGWYIENYTENLGPVLARGAVLGSSGEGRVAGATRADFAAAAVAVLTGTGQENRIYELGGDVRFSMADFAAEVSKRAGKPIVYQDLPPGKYRTELVGAGVPASFADLLVDSSVGIGGGELDDEGGDLRRLIGRPTTRLADAVAAVLPGRGPEKQNGGLDHHQSHERS
jgi:NAD(P)H dehydrogenase (quinone)